MKKLLIVILSTIIVCLGLKVNGQVEYDKYFTCAFTLRFKQTRTVDKIMMSDFFMLIIFLQN